jgi:hypothetical protein
MDQRTFLIVIDSKYTNFCFDGIEERLQKAIDFKVDWQDIDSANYDDAYKQLVDKLDSINHEVVICGFGEACSVTNTFAGYNRICVNPMLHTEDDELRMFTYNRTKDKENNSHCWLVFSQNCDSDEYNSKKKYLMMYYPNVAELDEPETSLEELTQQTLIYLARCIVKSGWIKDGVRFEEYGRFLVDADYSTARLLVKYKVPYGVTVIGESAFFGIDTLEELTLSSTVRNLSKSSFAGCLKLTEIELPIGVEVIPEDCFAGCASLYKLTLPSTIRIIKDRAFSGCPLQEVAIPGSVEYISPSAFDDNVKFVIGKARLIELLCDSHDKKITMYE